MPELPEVETVRHGLLALIGGNSRIDHVELKQAQLRYRVPSDFAQRLAGLPINGIDRRAKYLLWRCGQPGELTLINHLGMTGSWRLSPNQEALRQDIRKHDHCILHLQDGRCLVYHDPRRFGMLDYFHGHHEEHIRLAKLGPEPLDTAAFHSTYLYQCCRKRKASIKQVIMDQAVVVGVGNIYASESLHRAGINPKRSAAQIGMARIERLVSAIREILDNAIRAGGSTISDFRQAGGSGGYFQHQFQVYERRGEACLRCGGCIAQVLLGQRSSYYCPRCQK